MDADESEIATTDARGDDSDIWLPSDEDSDSDRENIQPNPANLDQGDRAPPEKSHNDNDDGPLDALPSFLPSHNMTQVAKTSTNYIEMKDRLRKKLKKRQSENKHKQGNPRNGLIQEGGREDQDPLEKKGLEALLSYINGTDSHGKAKEKEQTAKAAKRARQKQKKLEEKARQEKSNSPSKENCYPQPQKTLRQLIMNQTLNLGAQPGLDPKSSLVKSKSKKSVPGTKTFEEENRDAVPSPIGKEVSRSSSLIIESTRPTISVASKDLEKHATSQQKLHTGNNSKETPPHMIHILSALQSLGQQQQQQQNKNKSANCTSVINTSASSQAKSNGIIHQAAKPPKSTSEDAKVSGVSKPEHSSPQKQHQQQPPQQPKQHQAAKSVNEKVSRSAGNASHVTANGKSNGVERSGQVQFIHMNGGPPKAQTVPAVTSEQQPMPNVSSGLSLSVKKSIAGSPGAGSGSSASQSPSCGTKASADQGKTSTKAKKNKKKNKNGDISGVDEIFMPKSEAELEGDVDEFERELEEFKRFCFEPAEPKERRKIAVNVNLKDIFKKKTGMV